MSRIDRRGIAERSRRLSYETAQQGRVSLRTRIDRLRGGSWAIAQTALGAGLAWTLASAVLGQDEPVFAPIAAVIALGVTFGQRGRRAVELIGGVVVGIAIADGIVVLLGAGPLQVALVVALAMSAALLIGGGGLLVTEAGVSATLITILHTPGADSLSGERVLEAMLGGSVAVVINYVFFPLNPELVVGRAAQRVFSALGGTLEQVAAALAGGDSERAEDALTRARAIDGDMDSFREAMATGQETARLAPPRRRSLGHLELYAESAPQLDLAVRNTRVLARAVSRFAQDGEPGPAELVQAVRELSEAVWALAGQLEEPDRDYPTRELALRAAARATGLLEERGDLTISVVVGQVRSVAVDLLRASGLDRVAAMRAVEEASRPEPVSR
ncbi:MAG: FUSC family protein [Thermoleophilaceae bacterium]|nr:FUSC family protein [Thermoleophilaceae bacterium]